MHTNSEIPMDTQQCIVGNCRKNIFGYDMYLPAQFDFTTLCGI